MLRYSQFLATDQDSNHLKNDQPQQYQFSFYAENIHNWNLFKMRIHVPVGGRSTNGQNPGQKQEFENDKARSC